MTASRRSCIDILADLVAFDTVSANSNLALIAYVRDYLADFGVESQIIESESGEKANLFATIGPRDVGGIGLSGHTDVVPVAGQSWSSDPFRLAERHGRLYGRGAADMKGFIAAVLAMVPDFAARRLAIPIHLLFSYDEEVGCLGVRRMIAAFASRLVRPRLVIVGEPTSMRVVDAHKGAARFETIVTGLAAHSSQPQLGENAIHRAASLIDVLVEAEGDLAARYSSARFTPPWSTVQTGVIAGGTAQNIVPRQCRFTWEIRALPGVDPDLVVQRLMARAEAITAEMRKRSPECGIEIVPQARIPSFAAGRNSAAVSLALDLLQENETFAVAYGTEAGLFLPAGSDVVVCGPGDIAQAHAPDEFVTRDQLEACTRFLARLADHAQAGA